MFVNVYIVNKIKNRFLLILTFVYFKSSFIKESYAFKVFTKQGFCKKMLNLTTLIKLVK